MASSDSWMISTRRIGLVLVLADLVGGEEAGVDEFAEDLGGRITGGCKTRPTMGLPVAPLRATATPASDHLVVGVLRRGGFYTLPSTTVENRQQLIPLAHRPRALGGDQVAEQLADDGDALDTDAVHRRLGVARQRAADAADVVVGLAGEQAGLAIAFLPQPDERRRRAVGSAPRSPSTSARISSTSSSSSKR